MPAAVEVLDTTQLVEVTSPLLDAGGQTPSTNEPADETGATTDDPTGDAGSSDGEAQDLNSGTTGSGDPTVEPSPDPDAESETSTDIASQEPAGGTVDSPAGADSDPGSAVIDGSDQLPASAVADTGGGEDSGSTDDRSTEGEGSGSGTEGSGTDASGTNDADGLSSGETPQADIDQTPDKESSGGELPTPSDNGDGTGKEKSEETDKAEDGDAEADAGALSTEDEAADEAEEPDADLIEDYLATGTEVAGDEEEQVDSPKDHNNVPSPRAVRSDLNAYGSAYTGVKSGRSSSPWSDTAAEHRQGPSLAHLVGSGNRIEGTASFELVAEEQTERTEQSAQAIGKGFSLPFSNGFGMPLTGFDILVMSLMGLSLILVGVILFVRGLERQSAARTSTRRREVLGAPPASREPVTLFTRIRGFKRKRAV